MLRLSRFPLLRMPWIGLVCGVAMLGMVACQGQSCPLGSLPHRARQALTSSHLREGHPLTEEMQEQIYRMLYPHFGEVRLQSLPFRNEAPEYKVCEVTVLRLCPTCDVEVAVHVSPVRSRAATPESPMRLYLLSVDRNGRAFDRSLALAIPRGGGTEQKEWYGTLTLHLLAKAEEYEQFGCLCFVPAETFHEAADAIRQYPAPATTSEHEERLRLR